MHRLGLIRTISSHTNLTSVFKRTKSSSVIADDKHRQHIVENKKLVNNVTITNARAKPLYEIPGPVSLPCIGSTWIVLKIIEPIHLHTYLHKTYGEICLLRNLIGLGDSVCVFDIKDVEMMFRNEGVWPIREGFTSMTYYRNVIRKDVFGDLEGLVTSNLEPWADFRTKVNPIMMAPRTAQQYIHSINATADDFIERSIEFMEQDPKREMPDNYVDEIHKWALESIGAIALDKRLGCIDKVPSPDAAKMVENMLGIFKYAYVLDYTPWGPVCRKFNLPLWRRYVECQDYFTNKTLALIEEAIQRVENDPNYAQKTQSEKSSFEKLREKGKMLAVVMTLDTLSAGIDTTGKIAAAALYFLATNKDKQQKLRDEINRILPGPSHTITKESLVHLKYLRSVIKETMRMAPAAIANIRKMTKDVVLSGYNVPKGTTVIVPQFYLSMDEKHYKNAKQFIPERWMRDEKEVEFKPVSPFVTLPFGFGPRSCIGKRLANLELELLIAKMVRNFDLSWNYKPMTFGQELLYGVRDPLKLQMTRLATQTN